MVFFNKVDICEMALKSPFEAIAKPASITSTPNSSRASATRNFSFNVMEHPGDCSPSRNVVSKIITLFLSLVIHLSPLNSSLKL